MLSHYPKPPYPTQKHPMPGSTAKMDPRPDHGESSYTGAGKLQGKRAVITGGNSGIGRAVAIAYAREGADILIAYLNENDDAQEVKALIEKEGRRAVLVAGDLAQMLARKGIRANAVAPGPVWTPLIPSTMPDDAVKNFGKQVPLQRAAQPAELATAYVMLADPLSSYTSGTTVAVSGGKPFI